MKKNVKGYLFISIVILLFSIMIKPIEMIASKTDEPSIKLSTEKKKQALDLTWPMERQMTQPSRKFPIDLRGTKTTEFNQAGFVDNLTLPERTKRSEKDYIYVEFSSKIDYQVKPGDTLSLTLPSHLVGINTTGTPVVNDDNAQYGTMVVVGRNVKVTFNENVENYRELTGKLTIPVSGEINVDEEGELFLNPEGKEYKELESTSNLGTDLPDKPYIVWDYIYKPGEGSAKMFSKTGGVKSDYNFDVVEYRIQVKAEEYDVVDDISLVDTLDEYQYFPNESEFIDPYQMDFMEINYISEKTGEGKRFNIRDFEYEGYGTFKSDGDKRFKMTFDKDKANGYLVDIYYRVKLTDIAKTVKPDTVRNDVVETYHKVGEEETIEPADAVVPVNYPDASARPARGTLWLIKKKQIGDSSWSEQPLLPGVTFSLHKKDGTVVSGGNNLVTDKNGRIEFPDLAAGDYYVKEIAAPEGIEFDKDKKYEFTIDDSAKYGIILAISNKAKRPKADFIAKKEADKKILKPGEVFTYTITVENTVADSLLENLVVEDIMPEGIEIVGNLQLDGKQVDLITGDSFKVTIPRLEGKDVAKVSIDVKVKETAAEGDIINIAKVTDPNEPDKPKKPEEKVTVIRETMIRLIKKDDADNKELAGAVFELYQLKGTDPELLSTHTSDSTGRITIEKLKTGNYEIKEKIAPKGYELLDEPIKLSLDKYGELKLVEAPDELVTLNKTGNIFELIVKNKEHITEGVLPQTGGSGITHYMAAASLLLLISFILTGYYLYRHRKGWS